MKPGSAPATDAYGATVAVTPLASAETLAQTTSEPSRVEIAPPSLRELTQHGPRYETQRLLGEGGMGAVHACRDVRIGREVALKRMLSASSASEAAVNRFVREARIQGQLEHPAVVPVHDLEVEAGVPYFVMKRIRGLTLADVLSAVARGEADAVERFGRRRLLSAFVTVCLAVDFAHARGVVHRDLKPANVMLGEYGEVHLLDWGVARVVGSAPESAEVEMVRDASATSTVHGSIIGTPGYMSPEQVRGENASLDGRADVYALGVILFEILACEPLHRGRSAKAILEDTLAGVDPRPSARRPDLEIPPELDAICIRATALDPADRFSSARALTEALERFLDGDRDLELRREMAKTHAEKAREALARIGEKGTSGKEARAAAMREATRALAVDPQHSAGQDVLARLLLEIPDELPPEAATAMEKAQEGAREGAAKVSTLRGVGIALVAPIVAWMGVKSWPFFLTIMALLTALTTLNLWWWKVRRGRLERATDYLPFLVSLFLVGSMSFLFGPFILVPTLALLNGALFSVQSGYRMPRGFGALAGLSAVGPYFLELAGWLPPSLSLSPDRLGIEARLAVFHPVVTPVILCCIAFFATLGPLFMLGRLRRYAEEQERRLFLHSWHLRSMLPSEPKT